LKRGTYKDVERFIIMWMYWDAVVGNFDTGRDLTERYLGNAGIYGFSGAL
jgi:hypothetical protein